MAEAQVEVRILKHVGPHKPGDVIKVSAQDAEAMCTVRMKSDGAKLIPHRNAMPLAEWEQIKAAPLDKGGLTQGEMSALGVKNVTQPPKDPVFEARLESLRNGSAAGFSEERSPEDDASALEATKTPQQKAAETRAAKKAAAEAEAAKNKNPDPAEQDKTA